MFDRFASTEFASGLSCGIELDTPAGEPERAGTYLQFFEHHKLLEPFLESVGESSRR